MKQWDVDVQAIQVELGRRTIFQNKLSHLANLRYIRGAISAPRYRNHAISFNILSGTLHLSVE